MNNIHLYTDYFPAHLKASRMSNHDEVDTFRDLLFKDKLNNKN